MKDYPKRKDNDDYIHIILVSDKDIYDSVSILVVSSLETEESKIRV